MFSIVPRIKPLVLLGYGKEVEGITKPADLKVKPMVQRLLSSGLGSLALRHDDAPGNPGAIVVASDDFYHWLEHVDVLHGGEETELRQRQHIPPADSRPARRVYPQLAV